MEEKIWFDVVLDGNHDLAEVCVCAPRDVSEEELLKLAEQELLQNTYIYSVKPELLKK